MEIEILGSRGNIKKSALDYSKHSGVLVDKCLLLDLGEEEFLNLKPKWIFLTHLHPDHAFLVRKPSSIGVPIYGPEKHKNINLRVLDSKITLGSYRLTPIPTIHSKKVKSQAYLVQKDNQRLLYTGDLIWIKKQYHHLFGQLELVITEASFIRKGGLVRQDKKSHQLFGHAGIPDLINLFKPYTQQILLVHFGSWFIKDPEKAKKKLGELEKQNQIRLITSNDGLKITL